MKWAVWAASLMCGFITVEDCSAQGSPSAHAATLDSGYSCDQVESIKFSKDEYVKLSPDDRALVDATWANCDLQRRREEAKKEGKAEPDERVVVAANPAPVSGSSKIFYGIVRRSDLENAKKNCAGGGAAAGIALSIVGAAYGDPNTAQTGKAVYQYSGVACEGLAEAVAEGNLMVLVAPQNIADTR